MSFENFNIKVAGIFAATATLYFAPSIVAPLNSAFAGDYLPVERVQPKYPIRAYKEGVGGYVVLDFTVERDGTVPPDSITVLEAEPAGYFENVTIEAAKQFRYVPKKVGGVNHAISGVRYRFTFDLGKDETSE